MAIGAWVSVEWSSCGDNMTIRQWDYSDIILHMRDVQEVLTGTASSSISREDMVLVYI